MSGAPLTTFAEMARKRSDTDLPAADAVGRLDDDTVRRLLLAAADAHDDVLRSVRLAAAGDDERIAVLRTAVDARLRTRRGLDYWQTTEWANEAAPVVDALAAEVASRPSAQLIELLQRAAEHLTKVLLHADDSNGVIGGLAGEVLDLHRQACASGLAEPKSLAKWMVHFAFEVQDFFLVDPVAYAAALGEAGLAVYRHEVAKRSLPADELSTPHRWIFDNFPSSAARYAAQRLAVLDRDVERIVDLHGADLSSPYHFLHVAQAMVEIGRQDDALAWARRGLEVANSWHSGTFYDLIAEVQTGRGDRAAVLDLRREQHRRTPSATTYGLLQRAALEVDAWDAEIGDAREVLGGADRGGLIDVLLANEEVAEAWMLATTDTSRNLGIERWLCLAKAQEPSDPAGAMGVYLRLTETMLVEADRRNYTKAVKYLKEARRAAAASGLTAEFAEYVTSLREHHRRRPTLIELLDKAKLP